jgi:hypothetical protein
MPFSRLYFKNANRFLFILALVFIITGISFVWFDKLQTEKLASAQTLSDNVLVKATVLAPSGTPINYGSTTINYSNLPVVSVNNVTVNGQVTNLPVTCSFTFQSPSSQSVTVVTQAQNVNGCIYDLNQSPEQQNATVTQGSLIDLTNNSGIGQVDVIANLAGNSVKIPTMLIKIDSKLPDLLANPSLNAQNLEPPLNLNRVNTNPEGDLITKINFYSGLVVATTVAVSGYILVFFNIINNFKVAKFRDFTEELDFFMGIEPNLINVGEPIRFVSKILDETDKPVNNLPCTLTVVTPAGVRIKVAVETNKDGKCGVYVSKDGILDNQLAKSEENLNPGKIISGDFKGCNQSPGHGIAYTKAQIYSQRYRSRQLSWQVNAP